MTYEEIRDLVKFDENYENDIYMPNEIFIDFVKRIKNSPHIAFSYAYIFLISWLYRYAKYSKSENIIDSKTIKEILGYSASTKSLNYLIKQKGLLDEIEYTESIQDYPISWEYSKEDDLSFLMFSEYQEFSDYLPTIHKQSFLKYPTKGFVRTIEDDGEVIEIEGTFYDVSDTHKICMDTFIYSMSKKDVGSIGFYLHSYISYKNDSHPNGADISLVNLSKETGIAESTLDKYLNALKGYGMIDFWHNQDFFVVGLSKDKRLSNSYIAITYDFFNDVKKPFDRIEIMKKKDYFDMLEQERLDNQPKDKVEIDESTLPY